MKKWNVILWVFTCLFFAVWIYFDIYIKSESLYWLVGKWLWIFLIFVGQTLIIILKKEESKASVIFRICFVILFIGFWGYRDLEKYKSNICDDRFGREFNVRRRRLGVPEIPADWHVDRKERGHVTWKAKDSVGHTDKSIWIDSTCAIEFEIDGYKLKCIDSVSRDMSISTYFARGKASDSIIYRYGLGDSTRLISRQQADSIFAAEKIKKDY
ncbi:MAG TPA: hypothetical protein VFE54_12515 [Mucilaginibacter sp.]|nr:hypothetical protein [Mucilaginibacter sp.]